ncbi:MFS general substrate transporter [Auricularia subglabra TFB-10046 SS5]|nr:MFS general substrate transporter [Auricularia subglabra TFB-10046 SS5]
MSALNSRNLIMSDPPKEPLSGEKEAFESVKEAEPAADVRHEDPQPPGVTRIQAFSRAMGARRWTTYVLYGAIGGIMVATCLDGSTISSYEAIAAGSYGEHGQLLATISIVTTVMDAVSKPFIAKICDISSRQTALVTMLCCYVLGYAIVAGSRSAAGFAAGRVLSFLGNSGLQFTTNILISDISPLQWRGFVVGLTSTPWIWFSFVGPNISGPIIDRGLWRWGYGMFCIITPVLIIPAALVLYAAERRTRAAAKLDTPEIAVPYDVKDETRLNRRSHCRVDAARGLLVEIDAIGLFLIAAAFILLLTPFSLESQQSRGWNEPFIIAMMTLGAVLVMVFFVWELRYASVPLMTKRIFFNRTFLLALGIDFAYFIGGYMQLVYYSSYVYVVTNWTTTEWGYFNNTSTVAGCAGALLVGVLFRVLHRYKSIQTAGLMLRCVGAGIIYYARGDKASTSALIAGTAIAGLGGAGIVLGTPVATQASVPHNDLASVIALLNTFTVIGGSIGSAVAGAVWTNTMPGNLLKEGVPAELIPEIYGNVLSVHDLYLMSDPVRQAVIRAASKTLGPLFLASVVTAIIGVIFGLMMPNYILGKAHNAVDGTDVAGRQVDEERTALPPKLEHETWRGWIKREFF